MSIIDLTTDAPVGLVDVSPQFIYIDTNATQNAITTPGYLNNFNLAGQEITKDQIACVTTSDAPASVYNINIDSVTKVITLTLQGGGSGDVSFLPPVVMNRLAVFTDNIGTIGDPLNTTAVHVGNIQLGSNGNAGKLISFPPTANRGTLTFQAVNSVSGNANLTISNDNSSPGIDTVATVPFSGFSAYRFLVSDYSGEQFVENGDFSLVSGDFSVYTGHFVKCQAPTQDRGGLWIHGSNNSGNFQTILTNRSFNQNTTFFIEDPGTLQSSFILSTWTTSSTQQIISGNLQTVSGSLICGDSGGGVGGQFISYPPTASSGTLQLSATNNISGDFATIITNANNISLNASYVIPNTFQPDNSIIVAIGENPFTPRHMVRAAAATSGPIIEDAGAAFFSGSASSSGGSPSVVFTVVDCTSSSKVTVSVNTYTNLSFVASVTPGSGSITVNFSADPGAVTIFYTGTTGTITSYSEEYISEKEETFFEKIKKTLRLKRKKNSLIKNLSRRINIYFNRKKKWLIF
jgi:hypothetical protein